jgi:hypothetical protein
MRLRERVKRYPTAGLACAGSEEYSGRRDPDFVSAWCGGDRGHAQKKKSHEKNNSL